MSNIESLVNDFANLNLNSETMSISAAKGIAHTLGPSTGRCEHLE